MKKYVLFVIDHLVGERSGRKTGKMSNIVARDVDQISLQY